MWAGIGRALLYGFTALGVADIFGFGDDDGQGGGLGLWGNPLVIIAMIILLIILMNNLSKLKLN